MGPHPGVAAALARGDAYRREPESPPLTDAEHPGPPYKFPYGPDDGDSPGVWPFAVNEDARELGGDES
jgi:hypothetical protein